MPNKITLALKVKSCPYCQHADKAKLRQHRDYCTKFKAYNGHCENFKPDHQAGLEGD